MKCVTIAGTRPEFIQIARLSHALRAKHQEILVNTGQHYDDAMSGIFFRELDIPKPDFDLGVGAEGSSHAQQTSGIMLKLEPLLLREQPDWVIVYGDTNSTLAGALVGAKLGLKLAHIEAGLRSFDRRMPEEINRVLVDHVSDLLLSPTVIAERNLAREGITHGVVNVGDVRVDVLRAFVPLARQRRASWLSRVGLSEGAKFALATIHRASNTDDRARLAEVVASFDGLSVPVVLPVHPRLQKSLERHGLRFGPQVRPIESVGFLDMLALLDACSLVLTDSGGLQKEAYMLERPCVTLRDTTEWVETVEAGWNRLAEPGALVAAADAALSGAPASHPALYGSPGVSERIVNVLEQRSDA